jgi:hypothetical protein
VTATAAAFVAYAKTFIGKGYGQRTINGKPQRGPDYFDCIGLYRELILHGAPALWPTAWDGPDSWTVPNYVDAYRIHGLPWTAPPAAPQMGDGLVFGHFEHIGVADGAGNVISALNVAAGVCSVPISKLTLPLTIILRNHLTPDSRLEPAQVMAALAYSSFTPETGTFTFDGAAPHSAIPQAYITPGKDWIPVTPAEALPVVGVAELSAPLEGGVTAENRSSCVIAIRNGVVVTALLKDGSFVPSPAVGGDAAVLAAKIAAAIAALS